MPKRFIGQLLQGVSNRPGIVETLDLRKAADEFINARPDVDNVALSHVRTSGGGTVSSGKRSDPRAHRRNRNTPKVVPS